MNPIIEELYAEYVKIQDPYNLYPAKDGIRDERGHYQTAALFVESCDLNKLATLDYDVPYTLNKKDLKKYNRTYKSIYLIYMDCRDDYDFSQRVFGSFSQFEKFLELKWFMEGKNDWGFVGGFLSWKKEKEARDRSLNLLNIISLRDQGNLNAAKAIEDRFKEANSGKRGRPSQEDIDGILKQDKRTVEALEGMDKRLKLVKSDAPQDSKATSQKRA